MGKIIKGTIQETIEISTFESRRCSRDCPHCWKEMGLYKCHLRGVEEEIEKLDDVNDPNYPTADTYGFQRTDFCLKTFGNGDKSENAEVKQDEKYKDLARI